MAMEMTSQCLAHVGVEAQRWMLSCLRTAGSLTVGASASATPGMLRFSDSVVVAPSVAGYNVVLMNAHVWLMTLGNLGDWQTARLGIGINLGGGSIHRAESASHRRAGKLASAAGSRSRSCSCSCSYGRVAVTVGLQLQGG